MKTHTVPVPVTSLVCTLSIQDAQDSTNLGCAGKIEMALLLSVSMLVQRANTMSIMQHDRHNETAQ